MSITSISNSQTISLPYLMKTYLEIDKKVFFKEFGNPETTKICGTDEHKYSEDKSITSFEIGDCITVFAVEKLDNKINAIMGFHISDDTTVDEIKEECLNDYIDAAEKRKFYEISIIGGTQKTTNGNGCLLNNIHQAIKDFFINENFKIIQEHKNMNATTNFKFISANLQMDGTLTLCRHGNKDK